MSPRARLALAALAACQLAWLDPHAKARQGNRLFAEGKYDEAAARYNEALVDHPDSPLLHFNLGDAAYKQGKHDEAVTSFQKVAAEGDPGRTARVAYNLGNAKYRLGEAAEASEPQKALGLWAEALVAYRRAMGAAPDDLDAKVNYELVERKIAELRKKLEEQQKEQPQQQEGEQQPDEQKSDEKKEEQPQENQQQAEQPPQDQQAPQAAGEGEEEEKPEGEMSRQEAAALLDSQREQEVRPDEIVKQLQGAVVAEPAEDW
jgi:tetratricopeptide (TPR) repeat protein